MQQERLNLVEFQRKFATEEACMEHLFKLRWPEGYHCPRCGHGSYCFHSMRRLYQCSKCKYQVSVTAGTIFHKTRTALVNWFRMIFMMARGRAVCRCSVASGCRDQDVQTVRPSGHEIRKAMADQGFPVSTGWTSGNGRCVYRAKKTGTSGSRGKPRYDAVECRANRDSP